MVELSQFENEINAAMAADRHRLRRKLKTLRELQQSDKPLNQALARFADELSRSVDRFRRRASGVPSIRYDQELPILAKRNQIAEVILSNQVVVISGETGSGKSTQLPKICLEIGRGVAGMIGHTQPRRIAARTIATRLAQELDCSLGRQVGFKVRFTDVTSPDTYIKLMTDGMLLAETQGDRYLEQYDTIILDEAHERSLNVDFLIGFLKRLLAKRSDLKLLITSATIDAVRFARHFGSSRKPAPVVEVSGRTFPVEIRYQPIEPDDEGDEPDLERAVLDAVGQLLRLERSGDVLVFMPTERHIHDTAKALRGRFLGGDSGGRPLDILPLYARLPAKQQQLVFEPSGRRRIVIATNVAESSLTVPGIRYVVDPGTARISRYSPRSKTQRLPIEAVSQASADQRAGRCGRVGPGVCIRLYSEQDYDARDRFTPPEILRSSLASVILQTQALSLGNVESFPFIDPPKRPAIRDGYATLSELQAIDDRKRLTPTGRKLARMPVDPRIGRIILAADDEGCLAEMLIIAAALEVRDPRERPVENQQAADESHNQFAAEDSDFLSYLKLWDFYHRLKEKLSRSQLKKACRQNFLSQNRIREWLDVHRQLLQLAAEAGLKPGPRLDDYGAVHRAVLSGLLANVAMRTDTYEYTAAGGNKAFLWPGSNLFNKRPGWIVAAEMVETGKRYLRTCARIDPQWVEPLAEHLVKRSYHEPHWHRASGTPVAFEKVSLFGLPIVARRRVAFGPVDPAHARQLFIQHGLVEGEMNRPPAFLQHNRELVDRMERLQAKLRRSDLMLGEWSRYEFYDERLPGDVYDAARLKAWLRSNESDQSQTLFMTPQDVASAEVDEDAESQYPDSIQVDQNELPLEYRHEPGTAADGITVRVPVAAVPQLRPGSFEWLVPGLLESKVAALIKSLPKPLRRKLVPAPDTARKVVADLRFREGNLLEQLALAFSRIAGEPISPSSFDVGKLPGELRMNVRVESSDGITLAEGRDLNAVRQDLGETVTAGFARLDAPEWTRDGIVGWDFDALPETVEIVQGGMVLQGYPALIDNGDSVALRLVESAHQAADATQRGLRRLCLLAARRDVETQVKWFPDLDKIGLYAASIAGFALKDQLAELIAERAFVADRPVPRSKTEFEQFLSAGRGRIVAAVHEVAGLVKPLFEAYHQARLAVDNANSTRLQHAAVDAQRQIDALVGPDFFAGTPWPWLTQFPRYFHAIVLRFEKLRSGSLDRDRRSCFEVAVRMEACQNRVEQHQRLGIHDPELAQYRWMLEEYRVSLFAQELGTSIPVSAQRLDRQWAKTAEETAR